MDPDAPSPVCAVLAQVSMIDFPGRLAAVLFTARCNFRCRYCHNAPLVDDPPPPFTWGDLRRRLTAFREQWADGAVITGGEPTLEPGLEDLVDELRRLRFAVKLDTNGSRPDVLRRLLPKLDYVALDVKTAPGRYADLTGFDNVAALDESLRLLREGNADHEVRTTVLPDEPDDACLQEIARWVRGVRRWVLQPFVPRPEVRDPALRDTPRTPAARLRALRERLVPIVPGVTVRGAVG